MSGSHHRAELLRLARVLGVEPDALDFLDAADPADVHALRIAVMDRLLERNRRHFERAVALADHLPAALTARLAQHAMGPVLSGRAAALLAPAKAAELARRLPPDFLAEVAVHVDLRRVGPMLAGIPAAALVDAAAVLRRREEWVVLGAFLGHVDGAVLRGVVERFDGEALLRTGFVADPPERLDDVVALLPDGRVDELLDAAAGHGLWYEAASLAARLGDAQRARIAAAVERLDPDRRRTATAHLAAADA